MPDVKDLGENRKRDSLAGATGCVAPAYITTGRHDSGLRTAIASR